MYFIGHFLGGPKLPVDTPAPAVQACFDVLNQTFDVDDRVTGKDFWKTVGKTAGDAFFWPLG